MRNKGRNKDEDSKIYRNYGYLDLLTRKLSTYLYVVIDHVAIVFFNFFKFSNLFRVPMIISVLFYFLLLRNLKFMKEDPNPTQPKTVPIVTLGFK